jgi:hypothetical protein
MKLGIAWSLGTSSIGLTAEIEGDFTIQEKNLISEQLARSLRRIQAGITKGDARNYPTAPMYEKRIRE